MIRQILTACLLIVLPLGFFETIAFAVVGIGLHKPPTFLGIIATTQGAGAIIGGLTAAAVMRRTNESALFAFACLLFTASSLLLIAAVDPGRARRRARDRGLSLHGCSCPCSRWSSAARRLALQGRVYSAFDTLIGLPQTISIAVGAGLIAIVDYRLLLIFSAVMGVIAAVYLLTREEQRSVPPEVAGEPEALPYAEAEGAVTLPMA